MSLKICNIPADKENRQSKIVGTIKCQFKLAGLVRTDTEAKRQIIEKRLSQRFKDMDIFCLVSRSPLTININKETQHVCFILELKIYHINESSNDNAELAAARWFSQIGRMIPKIILGSSTWAAEFGGLSTNIIPSYLFALEEASGSSEAQPTSRLKTTQPASSLNSAQRVSGLNGTQVSGLNGAQRALGLAQLASA